MTTTPCPSCGAPTTGKFCSECGASVSAANCRSCQAPLTPGARFCHRCGVPTGAVAGSHAILRRGKAPWMVAAGVSVVLVGWLIWRVNRGVEVAPPPAGRTGGANPIGAPGTPPDLSQMTGRDAFLRLHDRIMESLSQGDSAGAAQFAPMAIQAYEMLTPEERDIDIRYHAVTLMLGNGDLLAAQALTDTIARLVPGHLFIPMLRAGLAEARNDPATALREYRAYLAAWDREITTSRQDYIDHRPLLDAFRERAQSFGR